LWDFQVGRKAREVVAKAEQAEKKGDIEKAERLYSEHLAVVPGDLDVQLRYADVLLKGEKSLRRQEEALSNFEGILRLHPGREDVRRRAAELAFEMNQFEKARTHLGILVKTAKDDGHLEYLMGRCLEQETQFARAAEEYASAIQHAAPERFEAA
jgi:tetratricopeptide (TPR) repeat protein